MKTKTNPAVVVYVLARIVNILLLLGALTRQSYGYYNFLRLVTFLTTSYGIYRANKIKNANWLWIFGIGAFIFNPLLPIHLSRQIWALIDVGMAIVLFISLFSLKQNRRRINRRFDMKDEGLLYFNVDKRDNNFEIVIKNFFLEVTPLFLFSTHSFVYRFEKHSTLILEVDEFRILLNTYTNSRLLGLGLTSFLQISDDIICFWGKKSTLFNDLFFLKEMSKETLVNNKPIDSLMLLDALPYESKLNIGKDYFKKRELITDFYKNIPSTKTEDGVKFYAFTLDHLLFMLKNNLPIALYIGAFKVKENIYRLLPTPLSQRSSKVNIRKLVDDTDLPIFESCFYHINGAILDKCYNIVYGLPREILSCFRDIELTDEENKIYIRKYIEFFRRFMDRKNGDEAGGF